MNRLRLSRVVLHSAIFGCALFLGAKPSVAQDADEGWKVTFTPYAWLAGQTGQVGIGGSVTDVDLSFGDVAENLDMGLMGVLEARHGRWAGRLDLMYISLLVDQDVTQPVAGEVELQQDQVVAHPEVGYAVLQRPWGGIDALAGFRYWHLTADLGVSVTGGPSTIREGSQDWADATVGGRIRYRAGDKWRLYGKVDLGAGGSEFTWQAFGGAAYDLGRCCALTAGYRHLDVNYDSDEFLYDTYLTGPALGIELRF
jgi:hypothetical protein